MAHYADSVIEMPCPFVCVSVCAIKNTKKSEPPPKYFFTFPQKSMLDPSKFILSLECSRRKKQRKKNIYMSIYIFMVLVLLSALVKGFSVSYAGFFNGILAPLLTKHYFFWIAYFVCTKLQLFSFNNRSKKDRIRPVKPQETSCS